MASSLAPGGFDLPSITPQRQSGSSYLPTLDGWRAIAILWVMFHHDGDQLFGPVGLLPNATILQICQRGPVGVDIFFGISGFLICSRLLDERRRQGRIDLTDFYLRRSFRILPPYLMYLVIVGFLALSGLIAIGGWEYLSCFLFLRNYLPTARDGLYTRHFWSLAVEEHFYLIWPGILVLCATVKRATWTALGLALLVTVWRGVDARLGGIGHLLKWEIAGNDIRTDTRLDGLFLGCWMALLLDNPAWRGRFQQWLSPAVWFLLLGIFLRIVFVPGGVPVYRLWIAVLVSWLLAGTVLRPKSWVGRILESPPLRHVGRISYSLYLWQQLFLVPRTEPVTLGPFQQWPFDWVMVALCATLSYHLIEQPMIAIGRRVAQARRTTRDAIHSADVADAVVDAEKTSAGT